jgi:hypothetical protein
MRSRTRRGGADGVIEVPSFAAAGEGATCWSEQPGIEQVTEPRRGGGRIGVLVWARGWAFAAANAEQHPGQDSNLRPEL